MENKLRERARQLRTQLTDAEQHLWIRLRNRRLCNAKFSRQFVIGSYIVDFVCREQMLIIELDGGQHLSQVEYDEARTIFLNALGYTVLRFWNNDVFIELESVLNTIASHLPSPAA